MVQTGIAEGPRWVVEECLWHTHKNKVKSCYPPCCVPQHSGVSRHWDRGGKGDGTRDMGSPSIQSR